jgi:hypothetical protein
MHSRFSSRSQVDNLVTERELQYLRKVFLDVSCNNSHTSFITSKKLTNKTEVVGFIWLRQTVAQCIE